MKIIPCLNQNKKKRRKVVFQFDGFFTFCVFACYHYHHQPGISWKVIVWQKEKKKSLLSYRFLVAIYHSQNNVDFCIEKSRFHHQLCWFKISFFLNMSFCQSNAFYSTLSHFFNNFMFFSCNTQYHSTTNIFPFLMFVVKSWYFFFILSFSLKQTIDKYGNKTDACLCLKSWNSSNRNLFFRQKKKSIINFSLRNCLRARES
jgi:hypothetical protein